jgi:hypothetical protein
MEPLLYHQRLSHTEARQRALDLLEQVKHLLGPMEPLSAILYPLRRRVSRPPSAALHLRRALAGATKALVQKCF